MRNEPCMPCSVNEIQKALSRAVASKAEMYGFRPIIWSSGALQVHRFGVPGIAGVIAVTCRGFSGILPKGDRTVRVFGGMHVLSVMGSIVAGWAAALPSRRASSVSRR